MSATQQQIDTDDSDSPGSEPATETEPLPLDQVFEILKNRRRREVLKYLDGREESVSLSDLAEHVAAIENDTTVRALSSSQRKRVYVGLYQCHLPKMDDMDVVEFDQNRGRIELGDNADQLETYLEPESSNDYWHRYYVATSLLGAGLFVVSQVGGASVGLTPTVVLVALLLTIFVVSVLYYCAENDIAVRFRTKLPNLFGSPSDR